MNFPEQLQNADHTTAAIELLTKNIQDAIHDMVPISKPRPDTKCWWSKQVMTMRKNLNRIKSISYQYRVIPDHFSHTALKQESNRYGNAIIQVK